MAEFDRQYASSGKGNAGVALGTIGTVLGGLAVLGGNAGNLLGGNRMAYNGEVAGCSENQFVNRYELQQEQKISELQSQVALRDANTYNDQKLLEVYKYFDGELKDMRATQCDKWANQGVINAKFESGIDVMSNQIASINNTIANVTKQVIPNSAICPGYGNVCVQTTGCSMVTGYDCNTY